MKSRVSRGQGLKFGTLFFLLGIVFLFIDNDSVRLIGAIEMFIGALLLIIYNSEKYKYCTLMQAALLIKGFRVSFRNQRIVALLLCILFFFCNAFSWGLLDYLDIIPQWVCSLVGGIFILFLLPTFTSPDEIERQLANDHADKLIEELKSKYLQSDGHGY